MPRVTAQLPAPILPAERNIKQTAIQEVALKIVNSRQNVFFLFDLYASCSRTQAGIRLTSQLNKLIVISSMSIRNWCSFDNFQFVR